MATGEDFLMRPCAAGMCKFESMLDGTLDLADVAAMNEYLDIKAANEAAIEEYIALKGGGNR